METIRWNRCRGWCISPLNNFPRSKIDKEQWWFQRFMKCVKMRDYKLGFDGEIHIY